MTQHRLTVRRACAAVKLAPSSFYYRAQPRDDTPVIEAFNRLVAEHPRWGFWKCHDRLRLDGHPWNPKRTHRVYCGMRLNQPRRAKRRRVLRVREALRVPEGPNHTWSMDFMHDTLYWGRTFRTLNVVDDFAREALAIEADTSLPTTRVVRVLEQLAAWRGLPQRIRVDNGPEFLAESFVTWAKVRGIEIVYIQPGKPNQNAFIERFNRSMREEVLDLYLFNDLDEVREVLHHWRIAYNERRPHDALGDLPPAVYRRRHEAHCSTSGCSD